MKFLSQIAWAAALLPFAQGMAWAQSPAPDGTQAVYTETLTSYETTIDPTVKTLTESALTEVQTTTEATAAATTETCSAELEAAGACTSTRKDLLETGLDDPGWTNVPDPCPPGDATEPVTCAMPLCSSKSQPACNAGYELGADGCPVVGADGCPICCAVPSVELSCDLGYQIGADGCAILDTTGAPTCVTSGTSTPTLASSTLNSSTTVSCGADTSCPIDGCDDGGVGPADPGDGGVYGTELRPFLLYGDLGGLGECAPAGEVNLNALRPLSGGTRVVVENTTFTAYDFAGNEFDDGDIGGNVEIDLDASEYAVLMQRYVETPDGLGGFGKSYVDYRLRQVRWAYQGAKVLNFFAPVPTTGGNPFTAPATGDYVADIAADQSLVSVRFEVAITTPYARVSGLRFRADATDQTVIAHFVSGNRVDGNAADPALDPADIGGFVFTTDAAQRETVVAELLLPRDHTYSLNDIAVQFMDTNDEPLSEVQLPDQTLTIGAGCERYTVAASIAMPNGRIRGVMHFKGDDASGPRAANYHPSFFGFSETNGFNGSRLGYNINGTPRRIAAAGADPIAYDHRAVSSGRWAFASYARYYTATVRWPAGFGPGYTRAGFYRWPNPGPGQDAIAPVDLGDSSTQGVDRDGFFYLGDEDPDTYADYLFGVPGDLALDTEEINFISAMAYVRGSLNLTGCAKRARIVNGVASAVGLRDTTSSTFLDERSFTRRSVDGAMRGVAIGIFDGKDAGDGTFDFQIAASQGTWREGGFDVNLRRGGAAGQGYYNGRLGFARARRGVATLQAGVANELSAPALGVQTAQQTFRLSVRNEDGSARAFNLPYLITGNYNAFTNGVLFGTYWALSYGVNLMLDTHFVDLIAVADSLANVRFRARVPKYADGTGGLVWASFPMLRSVPFKSDGGCADGCMDPATGKRFEDDGTAPVAKLYAELPNTSTEAAIALQGVIQDGAPSVTANLLVNGQPVAVTLVATEPEFTTTFDALVPLELGENVITLEVTDICGNTQVVTWKIYRDEGPPPVADCGELTLSCPDAVELECQGARSATFDLGSAYASFAGDVCDTLLISEPGLKTYPLGTTSVGYVATAEVGRIAKCETEVTVKDTFAPEITGVGLVTLWPPNHKYHTVTAADCFSDAYDACDETTTAQILATGVIVRAWSDEVEDTPELKNKGNSADASLGAQNGDGHTFNDIRLKCGTGQAQVRAERQGTSDGRVYTLVYRFTDGSGNAALATCQLGVPHDQGGSPIPIDDGVEAYVQTCE